MVDRKLSGYAIIFILSTLGPSSITRLSLDTFEVMLVERAFRMERECLAYCCLLVSRGGLSRACSPLLGPCNENYAGAWLASSIVSVSLESSRLMNSCEAYSIESSFRSASGYPKILTLFVGDSSLLKSSLVYSGPTLPTFLTNFLSWSYPDLSDASCTIRPAALRDPV